MSTHGNGYIQRITSEHGVNSATNRPTWKSTWVGVCECGERTDPKPTVTKARAALHQHGADVATLDLRTEPEPINLEGPLS